MNAYISTIPHGQVLRERLGVQCVLGLTATATRTTALSVASHLNVSPENILPGSTIPSNLHVTASCDDNRDDVSFYCSVAQPTAPVLKDKHIIVHTYIILILVCMLY